MTSERVDSRSQGASSPSMPGRALSSLGWAGVSSLGSKVVVFLSTLVLARLISPADFGLLAAGLTVVAYLELTLDLGVGAALVYEQESAVSVRVQTAFTLNLAVAIALTLVGVVTAPAVASFFHLDHDVAVFRLIFLFLLLRGLGLIQDALLRRELNYRRRAVVVMLRAGVRAAVSIGLALEGLGAWALVIGLLAGELAGTAASWCAVRFRPRLQVERAAVRTLLSFGLAFLALKLVNSAAENVDYLVVGHALGPDALGVYGMAYRLPELAISNVLWIFSGVAFSVYAKARADGPSAFTSAILQALKWLTLFGFPAGVGLALVSRDAVLVLFSDRWSAAAVPMALVSLALGVSAVGYASGDVFSALGRPGTLLWLDVPVTVLAVVAFVVASRHGLVAVAGVHVVVNVAYALARLVLAQRLTGVSVRASLAVMYPALGCAAGVTLVALPVRLALPPGAVALVSTIVAGLAGGVAGLAVVSPATLRQLRTVSVSVPRR